MEHQIKISAQHILDECIAQTSLDFQALRFASTPRIDINQSYDDFVITTDNRREFITELHSICALLSAINKATCNTEFSDDCAIFTIQTDNNISHEVIESLLSDYIKYNILAWWYNTRNDTLWQKYLSRSGMLQTQISSLLTVQSATRPLRYF